MPHYRVPFFQALFIELARKDIHLKVVYGQEIPSTIPRSVVIQVPWAIQIKNHYWSIFGKEIVWQPCLRELRKSDLIIAEQANRLLINYLLLAYKYLGRYKLAFWGHGKNFQDSSSMNLSRHWKNIFVRCVDWWFSYTMMSTDLVKASGYPSNKITTVQNAIDNHNISQVKLKITSEDLASLKKILCIDSNNIAIFCGGMYADKKLFFLLQACELIKKSVPDFHILFIGTGPDHTLIKRAAEKNTWLHNLGEITGNERVPYFLMSKCLLMPGLVGLVILDSFILETPIITTDIPIHSPEIAYLKKDINGLMTSFDVKKYAEAVVQVMLSKETHDQLQTGCKESAAHYTLNNMVTNFSSGITHCLSQNK